jgi:hypothetical protein
MRRFALIIGCCTLSLIVLAVGASYAAEKWQGIDEAVVQKIAREHGHEARRSFIDTGEGDLQLFMFLLAGAAGGFAAGYCWRALLEGKRNKREE